MPALAAAAIGAFVLFLGYRTGLLQVCLIAVGVGIALAIVLRQVVVRLILPSLLTANTEGYNPTLSVEFDEADSFERTINPVSVLLSAAVTGIIIVFFGPDFSLFRRPLLLETYVLLTAGSVILSGLAVSQWNDLFPLRKAARDWARRFHEEFEAVSQRLGRIERDIARLALGIAVAPPPSRLTEVIDAYREGMSGPLSLSRPGRAEAEVEAVIAAAESDLQSLGEIYDKMGVLTQLHLDAAQAVAESRLESLFAMLDKVWRFTQSEHLSSLIARREFSEVLAQIRGAKAALDKLIADARMMARDDVGHAGEGRKPDSMGDIWREDIELRVGDPHSIDIAFARLTARRGDPPARLKRIYKELLKIYHTDANDDGDGRRLQQLIEAYSLLREEELAE